MSAINARKAAYMMFEAGLCINMVQHGIDTIEQPSAGLYGVNDVMIFIRKVK